MWLDTVNLRTGHSLIMNHVPELAAKEAEINNIMLGERVKKTETDIASLGLFSSPSFGTYYPDVKAEDLKPTEAEFINPMFRILSETIVHRAWNPIDFSENTALKKALPLINNQSVKTDHEDGVMTTIGSISESFWDQGYKRDGVDVPAGINARLKIDGKSNPRLARLILMDPPGIHSGSVTVSFMWDKSHPSLKDDEFWNKLGSFDKDGKMIRRVVNNVVRFTEYSLVDHGADPFAQIVNKDGKIVNPKYAGTQLSALKKTQNVFYFDFGDTIANKETDPTIPDDINNNDKSKDTNMKELIQAFSAALGVTAEFKETDTVENSPIMAALTKLVADKKDADTKLAAAPTQEALSAAQAASNAALAGVRGEITETLNKLFDSKPAAGLVTLVEKTDNLESLQTLKDTYQAQLNDKFPLTCKKCKSHEVSRASAKMENPEGGEGGNGDENLSIYDKMKKHAKSNNTSFIHQ